jgi:energy-converting hydrogenase B subunit D
MGKKIRRKRMIVPFDIVILLFVLICAIAAISVKDLLSAVIILGAYSFLMCLLWSGMGAVDVAFTEASVSAGIGTVLLIAAVSKTKRRSKD